MFLRFGCRVILAIGLDVAAWLLVREVSALAENPGSASALVLCWVHAFVLPPLFARPRPGVLQVLVTASIGIVAAPIALAAGFVAGLQAGSMAFLIGFGISDLDTGTYHDLPGPLLSGLEEILGDIMLWSGPAAGSAVALIAAAGLAAIRPGMPHPRLSWWLVGSGAWGSVVFLPDWLIRSLERPWREPILLAAAGLPSIVLLLGRYGIRPITPA